MNLNYYQRFTDQIEKISKNESNKPSLLLQACCAPCSSHVLSVVAQYFDITVFFYNPNIDDKAEYDKRFEELKRFISEADFTEDVKALDGGYGPEDFFKMARGRENLPEGDSRCYDCYKLRLKRTAEYAAEHGFDYFSTTLSISPYKKSSWINEIGMELEQNMRNKTVDYKDTKDINGVNSVNGVCGANSVSDANCTKSIPAFLFSDFKKKNGYKHSIQLSKEYNLYRQDYCGCIFSKMQRERQLRENEERLT
ncbi:MAG: epoxyqueuosine reductase QueH [Eubacterium sp.]|nr:epoxyqueuosine reductase QueH [Eubacterium sp.]